MHDITVVIVPVFNEEKHLSGILGPLCDWANSGSNKKVIIVDDGSTDGTRKEFIKHLKEKNFPKNIQIIYSDPKTRTNLGKGEAFIAGATKARAMGAKILVTLDADLLDLAPHKIDVLVDELQKTKQNMLLVQITEKNPVYNIPEHLPPTLAGQRAIRMSALEPLFNKNQKWISLIKGYGLEKALCHLIPKFEWSKRVTLLADHAYRKKSKAQEAEIDLIERKIQARRDYARGLATRLRLMPLIFHQRYTPPKNKTRTERLKEIEEARNSLNFARKSKPHLGNISKSRIRR